MKVQNFRSKITLRFIKYPDKFAMRRDGRWGPRWLHRLVWRMAMNLGMVAHPIGEESVTTWRPVPSKTLQNYIGETVLGYLDENFNRNDLVCYVGRDMWMEATMDPNLYAFAELREEYWTDRGARGRILDIPIYMIPNMEGALVVPRPK